jgi:hypothetical protein
MQTSIIEVIGFSDRRSAFLHQRFSDSCIAFVLVPTMTRLDVHWK